MKKGTPLHASSGHDSRGTKRHLDSPHSWQPPHKAPRASYDGARSSRPELSKSEQVRLNQIQEDEKSRAWVAQEDDFVLKQAKKKAEIRVKDGRAKPIDWLAVALRRIDTARNPLDDELDDTKFDVVDPSTVLEAMSRAELSEVEKDIDSFLSLEKTPNNKDFWRVSWTHHHRS